MRLFKLNNHNKLILSILLACPFVVTADKAERIEKQINKSINQMLLTEKQKEDKANKIVVKAKDFFVNGKYKDAIDNYLSAIEIFKKIGIGETNAFDKQIKYCQEQIYQCYYYWAMDVVAKVEKNHSAKIMRRLLSCARKLLKSILPASPRWMLRSKDFLC